MGGTPEPTVRPVPVSDPKTTTAELKSGRQEALSETVGKGPGEWGLPPSQHPSSFRPPLGVTKCRVLGVGRVSLS